MGLYVGKGVDPMASGGTDDGGAALEALRWRDEILGVLFWLRGEGIMPDAAASDLGGFLSADPWMLRDHLERLTAEGYLDRAAAGEDARYRLNDLGNREGGRAFADDFAELTGAAHGECGPGCSCHRHGPGACKIPA